MNLSFILIIVIISCILRKRWFNFTNWATPPLENGRRREVTYITRRTSETPCFRIYNLLVYIGSK